MSYRSVFVRNAYWLVGFGVLSLAGYASREALTEVAVEVKKLTCGGQNRLVRGELAVKHGIELKQVEYFIYARYLLEDAAAGCFGTYGRNANAIALLGAMRCRGYGFPKDWQEGRRFVDEAHSLDPTISPEFFAVCAPPT